MSLGTLSDLEAPCEKEWFVGNFERFFDLRTCV